MNVHALNLEIAISIGDYDVDIEQFGDYQPKWPTPVRCHFVGATPTSFKIFLRDRKIEMA